MTLDQRVRTIGKGLRVTDAVNAFVRERAARGEAVEADPQEELRGIVELMYLMAAVDGEVSEEEMDELRASVMALQDLQALTIGHEVLTQELEASLASEGWTARLNAAAARVQSPEARGFAFQLAATVAFVDDFVAHAEAAAIDALANALELPKEASQRLLREVHTQLFGDEPANDQSAPEHAPENDAG